MPNGTTQQKFNPELVAVGFDKELPEQTIYGKFSYSGLAGKVTKPGEVYTIKQASRVGVRLSKIDAETDIYEEFSAQPEKIETSSNSFTLDHRIDFDFFIHKDEAEISNATYSSLINDTTVKGAEEVDKFIANLPKTDPLGAKLRCSNALVGYTRPTITKTNIISVLDYLIEEFSKHKIKGGKRAPLYMFIDEAFRLTLKKALVDLKTNNDELINQGVYGVYERLRFIVCDYIPSIEEAGKTIKLYRISTKEAVAWAHTASVVTEAPYRHTRVKNYIGDSYLGGKIWRPEEVLFLDIEKPVLTID